MVVLSEVAGARDAMEAERVHRVIPRFPARDAAVPLHGGLSWCSSLEAADLSALLTVIENQLLPNLIDAFPPSRQSPLPRRRR